MGRPASGRRGPAGHPRRQRQDRRAAAAPPRRRAARPGDGGRGGRVRHGRRRWRPGRHGGRRVRRVRGAAHDRRRARGARRPGRDVVADRELPRLPVRGLGRRAGQPRAAAGAPAGRRDPRHAGDRAHRRGTRQVHLDGGDVLRARTIILACGVSWRQLSVEGFDRLAGKGVSYGAARSEAAGTHGQDIHIVGAGNSAGQAAMYFSRTPAASRSCAAARASRRACPATWSSSSRRGRTSVRSSARRSSPPMATTSLEAIDVSDSGRTAGLDAQLASAGLFIFIGADAADGVAAARDRRRRRAASC